MARVVVTGMGAITPIGLTVEEYWGNIKKGTVGIDFIEGFDTSDLKVKVAAEIKNFNPEIYMGKKEPKRTDRYAQLAMAAAMEAVEKSGLDTKSDRVGVIVSSGIGGLGTMEEQILRMSEKGPGKISPFFIPMTISNIAAGNIAIKFGTKGLCTSVVTACASATNSIGEAYRNIKHGYLDACITGGAEASIVKSGIGGFASMTALSESNDPQRASIPFDKERDGFVMGEGAGILVLENLEHALARNAVIYGEIVGYGATCDAHHMTSPHPEGLGAASAIQLALGEAGISSDEVSYINAHGTSTQANDYAETLAIKNVFGEYAYKIPVSSTKSMTGHLLGAAGAVETIGCIMALEEGFIPATVGLTVADANCDLDYVPKVGRNANLQYIIKNSLGFGGHNAVLCLKKWE